MGYKVHCDYCQRPEPEVVLRLAVGEQTRKDVCADCIAEALAALSQTPQGCAWTVSGFGPARVTVEALSQPG